MTKQADKFCMPVLRWSSDIGRKRSLSIHRLTILREISNMEKSTAVNFKERWTIQILQNSKKNKMPWKTRLLEYFWEF